MRECAWPAGECTSLIANALVAAGLLYRSVRYCSKQCQIEDHRTRHKEDCLNFTRPPLVNMFLTEPIGDERYPHFPVFAHGHRDGVGCWVSEAGHIDGWSVSASQSQSMVIF